MTATTRRIDYRSGGHGYQLDGQRVDGVTSILYNGIPKQQLVEWAARIAATYAVDNWERLTGMERDEAIPLIAGAPGRDKDRNARRGTEVHELAVGLLHGAEVDVPEELQGHVDSYIKFLGDWDVEPVLVETIVGSRAHQWMGTLDAVGDFNDGLRRLYDIKTTRSGIFPETTLQVAAYRNAEFYLDDQGNEQPMIPVDTCAAIWVRADGYDLIPLDAGPHAYRMFRHAQQIALWQKQLGKASVGDALLPPARLEAVQ